MSTLGIILAGGASRRMGLPAGEGKASVLLAGRSLLEHVVLAVRPAVDRLLVVAAPAQEIPRMDGIDDIVRDSRPGAGPLAAIADGLRAAGPGIDRAVVASCDVPMLVTDVVRLLLDRVAAPGVLWAVPWVADHPQVLVSALQTSLLSEIEAHLAEGRRDPRGLIDRLRPASDQEPGAVRHVMPDELRQADPELMSFTDIDTPDDLARVAGR